MQTIALRRATMRDAAQIVEIYNSNPLFLQHHLGRSSVDETFVQSEMEEMKVSGFLGYLFVDLSENSIIGLADIKVDTCSYLSLLMLNSRFQRNGKGSLCYNLLEMELRRHDVHMVRIDVVCEYPENAKEFWSKQGFAPVGKTHLLWGGKRSEAVVMHKRFD